MKKYYTSNDSDEIWRNSDLDDAVSELIDEDGFITFGDIVIMYEGDLEVREPEFYLPDLAECVKEMAYDEHGEVSEDWLDGLTSELQADFRSWFYGWCKSNNQIPEFGSIINIKPIEIRILNTRMYDWELIESGKDEK